MNGIIEKYRNQIIQGDSRELMNSFPDGSFHCVVTSPPWWNLRNYEVEPSIWDADPECNHEWVTKRRRDTRGVKGSTLKGSFQTKALRFDTENAFCQKCGAWLGCLGNEPFLYMYLQHIVEIFSSVKRVLRPDGTLWLNMGDNYASGKGSCFNPGGGKHSFGQKRKSYGVHPRHRGNVSQLKEDDLKMKDLCGVPWQVALALRQPTLKCKGCGAINHKIKWGRFPDRRLICPACNKSEGNSINSPGWWLRSAIIWHKKNTGPESPKDRPTKDYEYLFLMSRILKDYYYDQEAIKELASDNSHSRGKGVHLKARIPSSWDTGSGDHRQLKGRYKTKQNKSFSATVRSLTRYRNKRSVWTIVSKAYKGDHYATFTEESIRDCIRAGTSEVGCCSECGVQWKRMVETIRVPRGDRFGLKAVGKFDHGQSGRKYQEIIETRTVGWQPMCDCNAETVPCLVFDPFGGSGTTGLTALNLGRNFVLIDISPKYHQMATERLKPSLDQLNFKLAQKVKNVGS